MIVRLSLRLSMFDYSSPSFDMLQRLELSNESSLDFVNHKNLLFAVGILPVGGCGVIILAVGSLSFSLLGKYIHVIVVIMGDHMMTPGKF